MIDDAGAALGTTASGYTTSAVPGANTNTNGSGGGGGDDGLYATGAASSLRGRQWWVGPGFSPQTASGVSNLGRGGLRADMVTSGAADELSVLLQNFGFGSRYRYTYAYVPTLVQGKVSAGGDGPPFALSSSSHRFSSLSPSSKGPAQGQR